MTRNRNDRYGSSDYDYDYVEQGDYGPSRRTRSEVGMDEYMRGDYRRGDTDDQGQGFINRESRRYVNDAARRPQDGQWQYRGEENFMQDQGRRQLGVQDDGRGADAGYGRRMVQPYYGERREEDRWTEGPVRRGVQVAGAYSAQEAAGSFRGKGPKGHQRSDERIREEVNDALEDAHNVDASDIEVTLQGGEVTLTGTVADRAQKRAAADCVEHLRGVRDVHNHLRLQTSTLNR
ncbi:transport-associated protein (plasmid) [Deinococcus proteolyticus MRP]|uniref:Transport-associated protein n=1 Tax=Deinococcus proteolyticus (strain ATCC 35074 / DSM 20540 / JCM 6276 / NBRC 101906 / NCIMB 13154 / VKM Ac-1939 / CCM 2703 / MRP) TaxID=693977 RepID=F0RPN9_DEIPM|nr:BON domain-containing protein [Deinococcus proteolyticus]ADY27345.1 transport-associated protein [Deinococcus proteolyticus MRP]